MKKCLNGKPAMLIEICNTYSVYQRTQHTFVEVTIFAHGKGTKVQAKSVWRSGELVVRIEDETEREHLKNAMFIEGENEDPVTSDLMCSQKSSSKIVTTPQCHC